MHAAMVNSPGLLETSMDGYGRFRRDSGFSPAEQEVVFLTMSRFNGCEYCMAAHRLIADQMSKVPPAVTDAIRTGRSVRDPMLSALSIFTAAGRDVRESGVEEARLNCSRRDGVARDAWHSLP